MKKCCILRYCDPNKRSRATPVGVSQVAWFRVFAWDKDGAVSIEFVVLVASLMGIGTLSAVTVQSGVLARAGIIGDRLEEAGALPDAAIIPTIFPQITSDGATDLPAGSTDSAGSNAGSGPEDEIVTIGGGGGGGAPSGGGDDDSECLPGATDPELGELLCDEQAAEFAL